MHEKIIQKEMMKNLCSIHLLGVMAKIQKLGETNIETPDGLTKETPVLKSANYNLAGRPDYLIKEGSMRIPVEVKTGRRPKAPFFSHVLQIGAYCLLSEETFTNKPRCGQIRYGFESDPHEVKWDSDLKILVTEKLEDTE